MWAQALHTLRHMSLTDPTDTRALERAQSQADERNAQAGRVEADDLKWLMSNKRGRRIAFRLLERAGVWRSSFNTNALTMAFSEGTRNLGLMLLSQITAHCAERYDEMLKESKE
jgi:hypothetical protein